MSLPRDGCQGGVVACAVPFIRGGASNGSPLLYTAGFCMRQEAGNCWTWVESLSDRSQSLLRPRVAPGPSVGGVGALGAGHGQTRGIFANVSQSGRVGLASAHPFSPRGPATSLAFQGPRPCADGICRASFCTQDAAPLRLIHATRVSGPRAAPAGRTLRLI